MRSLPVTRQSGWGLLLLGLVLGVACGGGRGARTGALSDPGDLRGKSVAVASAVGTQTLELRYMLQEAYGLDAAPQGGDLRLLEATAESLPEMLRSGKVDAALMPQLSAFQLRDEKGFAVLSHVTKEVRDKTGRPVMSSALVTYPDVVERKADALSDLKRMLTESLTYFKANQDDVIGHVATEQGVDQEYLRWWWERGDLALGDGSKGVQSQLLDVWKAGVTVKDINDYPDVASVLFDGHAQGKAAQAPASRTTVSLALLDDPSRRTGLYAITQGLVKSDSVDLDVTYLPASALSEAAAAKQYDVLEATPLVVPSGAAQGLAFVVLSGGVEDLDGTLLFVRSASPGG